jgi:hypothetical protein
MALKENEFGAVDCINLVQNRGNFVRMTANLRFPKKEDNIKKDPKEMVCKNADWIHMAQDRT